MRILSSILLISFVIPVWLSGQVNAQTINIYDEYTAGRRTIKEIIINNNLEDKLIGYSYCGYFISQSLFPVSYTHLDVYKRQVRLRPNFQIKS